MLSSIIIAAHNHLNDLTIPCISSIFENTRQPYELVCVDDFSSDGTYDYFCAVADKAYRTRKLSGANIVRNIGMASAQGDVMIFLDNDTIVPPGWLYRILKAYHPGVGIVGGMLSNEQGRRYFLKYSADGLIDVTEVSGACMSFSRAVFDRLGFLDASLINCGEDTDYCYFAQSV
jgi:GT2 family glycosyltransferase